MNMANRSTAHTAPVECECSAATSSSGPGLPLPHLRRDRSHPSKQLRCGARGPSEREGRGMSDSVTPPSILPRMRTTAAPHARTHC